MASFLRLKRMCPASGQNFYSYASNSLPDAEFLVICPECGKVVQLRKFINDRMRIRIASHYKLPGKN